VLVTEAAFERRAFSARDVLPVIKLYRLNRREAGARCAQKEEASGQQHNDYKRYDCARSGHRSGLSITPLLQRAKDDRVD